MAATVTFKITGGEVIPEIEMLASATILDLKKKIESTLGVHVSRQTLRFNNQVLKNDRKIDRYNFGESATVILLVSPLPGRPKFRISVKSPYDEYCNIKVKETTLVGYAKRKILDRSYHWRASSSHITLYRLSTKMDNEELPLSAYYVCEGSEIEVKFN